MLHVRRGNSAQEPLQEPSLQTGLGQGGDASGEASFYVSSSAREACMSEPSFAPAGAAAPGAEASLSSAVIDGRQCAAGKAGPSGRAVIEISAGGTPGEDRWRGPSRGHTPGVSGLPAL